MSGRDLFEEFKKMCDATCCQDCKYLGSGKGWSDCMMKWSYDKGMSDATIKKNDK